MTHASGKQPYGCCQPRMVELRSCLLPSCRNPRVHPPEMTMNIMMDWAAAEAEDVEAEAEDAQDSGTVSDGHVPPLMRATSFRQLRPPQAPSRTTSRGLGPMYSRRSPPHQHQHQHRIGARWPPASGVERLQPRPLARQKSSNPKPTTRR